MKVKCQICGRDFEPNGQEQRCGPLCDGRRITPSRLAEILRSLHPDMMRMGQNGKCFRVYQAFKAVWPDAIAFYDHNHVITLIDGHYYDITGEVQVGPHHQVMDQHELAKAEKWDAGKWELRWVQEVSHLLPGAAA